MGDRALLFDRLTVSLPASIWLQCGQVHLQPQHHKHLPSERDHV